MDQKKLIMARTISNFRKHPPTCGFRLWLLVILGSLLLVVAICTFGRFFSIKHSSSPSSCHCGECDCEDDLGFLKKHSFSDCSENDDPDSWDDEFNLLRNVTNDDLARKEALTKDLKEASRVFKMEAEKCILGVTTCEEGRERAQARLQEELKLSAMWERRALDLGWTNEENLGRRKQYEDNCHH